MNSLFGESLELLGQKLGMSLTVQERNLSSPHKEFNPESSAMKRVALSLCRLQIVLCLLLRKAEAVVDHVS
jgi:hypothetical protein